MTGVGDPRILPADSLLNLVYAMLTQGSDAKHRSQVDHLVYPPTALDAQGRPHWWKDDSAAYGQAQAMIALARQHGQGGADGNANR